jgi:site-specific DNA recombinase
MRVLIYCRTSGDDTAKGNIPEQERRCREFCKAKGYTVEFILKEDERGVSGANWNAPEFTRALDLAREGRYDILVCTKTSRFARDVAKYNVSERQLKDKGVRIELVEQTFEDSPEGQFQKNVIVAVDQLDKERISIRLAQGRRKNARNGEVVSCGRTAYGLEAVEIPDGAYRTRTTLQGNEYAYVVQDIYRMYCAGKSVRSIAAYLEEEETPTWSDLHERKTGKKSRQRKAKAFQWKRYAVSKILSNPVYKGEWSLGDISVQIDPIVNPKLWQAAQDRKARNPRVRQHTHYLLAGMARCSCGAALSGQSATVNGKKYRYYRCQAERHKRDYGYKCEQRAVRCETLEATLWQTFKGWMQDPESLEQIVKTQVQAQIDNQGHAREQIATLEQIIAEQTQTLTNLLTTLSDPTLGNVSKGILQGQIKAQETEITSLQAKHQKLSENLQVTPNAESIVKSLRQILRKMESKSIWAQQLAQGAQQDTKAMQVYLRLEKGETVTEEELAQRLTKEARDFLQEIGVKVTVFTDDSIELECLLGERDFALSSNSTSEDTPYGKITLRIDSWKVPPRFS